MWRERHKPYFLVLDLGSMSIFVHSAAHSAHLAGRDGGRVRQLSRRCAQRIKVRKSEKEHSA
jgi:hypothetical protein